MHHGKSTLSMDIFLNAINRGFTSLYVSMEQPSAEILLHLIQKETGIKPLDIKRGSLTAEEERILTCDIYPRFKKLPVHYEDQTRTLKEVLMRVRRMILSHKIRFVVIDYLQLIENPLKGEPRHIEVAGISRALKRLAMDLNISILLSQLNKNPEKKIEEDLPIRYEGIGGHLSGRGLCHLHSSTHSYGERR
jgi:replicative DNA helicase